MENQDYKKEESRLIPKIAQDSALATARMSVSFVSICFALLSVTDSEGKVATIDFHLPILRPILLLLGVLFVLNAAQTIDWIIDHFTVEDWSQLGVNEESLEKRDQFDARLQLFNGGYVLFSASMAVLIWAFLSQALMLSKWLIQLFPEAQAISSVISVLFSIYVFLQMMTDKLVRILYARTASALAIGVVLGAIFL